MKLINIGFGNMVSAGRLIAIVSPESAPIKRMIQEARDRGVLIDATYGRRTRAVLIMDSDHIVLSAIQPETVAGPLGRPGDRSPRQRRMRTDEPEKEDQGTAHCALRPVRCGKEHGDFRAPGRAAGHLLLRFLHHPPARGWERRTASTTILSAGRSLSA